MRNPLWPFIATLILVAATPSVAQNKKATPPTTKELVGAWIGFDKAGSEFTRLELNLDGSGFYAVAAPANFITHDYGVQLYKISRWSIEGWRVSFDLSPLTSNAEPASMSGEIFVAALKLKVEGTKRQWKIESTLYMESLLAGSNKEAKEAIATHKN